LTGVAAALTVGRYLIRGFSSRRFHWDDAVHLVAFLLLVIHGATNQLTSAAKTQLAFDEKPSSQTSDDALLAQFHYVYQLNSANNVFLYLVFWVVKVAFLMFYRMLFGTSQRFMKVWWTVLALTVITYFVPFGGVVATCFGQTTVAGYKLCNSAGQSRAIKLEYSCALNVATDVFIMALPLWMIRDLRMKARQKIALAFIFSLATFCIALDILRVVEALASNQNLYTVLEINMVVIISCLPTYGTLLTIRDRIRGRKASYSGYPGGSRRSQRSGSKTLDQMPISTTRSFAVDSWAPLKSVPATAEQVVMVPSSTWSVTHHNGSNESALRLPIQLSPEEATHASRW
jgi:hypothetical protein